MGPRAHLTSPMSGISRISRCLRAGDHTAYIHGAAVRPRLGDGVPGRQTLVLRVLKY